MLLVVGTAPFRNAEFGEAMRSFLLRKGISLHIMTSYEETQATFAGFIWALHFAIPEEMLFVDQGGGSTEISLIQSNNIVDSLEFPFGTLNSIAKFRAALTVGDSVSSALNYTVSSLRNEMTDALLAWRSVLSIPLVAVIGTAMTNLCDGAPREQRHGQTRSRNAISTRIDGLLETLSTADMSVCVDNHKTTYTVFDKKLNTLLGLVMVHTLMEYAQIPELVINGVGMRYGLFRQLHDECGSKPMLSRS